MNTEEKIIATLKSYEEAMSAGQIADNSGIDRKEIDKAMKVLKEKGTIVSPQRCYRTIT